jgi:uncharacterized protein (DUF1810 family)
MEDKYNLERFIEAQSDIYENVIRVNNIVNRSALEIFGEIDEMKFRSSMTLFDSIQQNIDIFKISLSKFFRGMPDKRTCSILMKKSN